MLLFDGLVWFVWTRLVGFELFGWWIGVWIVLFGFDLLDWICWSILFGALLWFAYLNLNWLHFGLFRWWIGVWIGLFGFDLLEHLFGALLWFAHLNLNWLHFGPRNIHDPGEGRGGIAMKVNSRSWHEHCSYLLLQPSLCSVVHLSEAAALGLLQLLFVWI